MNYRTMYGAGVAAALLIAGLPARASETDDRIADSFAKSYVSQTYLKDDAIHIAVQDGVVTLTGTVSEESHRTLAQETASSLPGVGRVDNQLSTKSEAAAESADVWIARKVKLALLFHSRVSARDTTVAVKDGIVTLSGEASSEAQRELAAEYAKDIEGVKEVRNAMTVAAAPAVVERTAGEKMDDASITAQVRTALLTHRSTRAISTKVVTRDGEVTLTGIARNAAEKALVTKLVTDIRGVTSVKNDMTIEAVKTS